MGFAGSQFHGGPGYLDDPLAQIPVLPPDPFAAAGPQDVLFLSGITALAGVGANALSAILTGSVSVPYVVEFMAVDGSGAVQAWTLTASTDATGPGKQRPNDFDASTNAKVWIQNA